MYTHIAYNQDYSEVQNVQTLIEVELKEETLTMTTADGEVEVKLFYYQLKSND